MLSKCNIFQINKLDKNLLKKIDKKLIILEIKNINKTFSMIEKFSFAFLFFLIGHIFGEVEVEQVNSIGNIFLVFIFLFLIFVNSNQAKQYSKYKKELYNSMLKKKKQK